MRVVLARVAPVVLLGLAVTFLSTRDVPQASSPSALTDLERAQQARDLLTDVTDTRSTVQTEVAAAIARIDALLALLAPVDCVTSSWQLVSTAWDVCQPNGTQIGTQLWTRDVLTAPANGGAACGLLQETRTVSQPCTYVPPVEDCGPLGTGNSKDDNGDGQTDEGCAVPPPNGQHAFFDRLAPLALLTHSMRTLADISKPSMNDNTTSTPPVEIDSVMDAALWQNRQIDATRFQSDMRQKYWTMPYAAGQSLTLTWDFKISASATCRTGVTDCLDHYKMAKIVPGGTGYAWLLPKLHFRTGNRPPGTIEFKLTSTDAQYWYAGGNMYPLSAGGGEWIRGVSSTGLPVPPPRYFFLPDEWVRVIIFLDGPFGGGVNGSPVRLHVWMVAPSTGPVKLYDGLTYESPAQASRFYIHYDSSDEDHTNGFIKAWGRNWAAIPGLTLPDVERLSRELPQ